MSWTDVTITAHITHIRKIHIDEIRAALDGHIGLGGSTVHAVATSSVDGFMSSTDKAILDSLVASSGGNVTAVTATLPIISSGGVAPNISIQAASASQPGYLSAADKAKLDSINVSGIGTILGIGVAAPITSTGGTTPTIGISAATSSADGSMSATDKTKLDGLVNVPLGCIIMWYGDRNTCFDGSGAAISGRGMEGWAICNGNNGTPNMTDKFPLPAGNKALGTTGGESTHILTTDEIPSHSHTGAQVLFDGVSVPGGSTNNRYAVSSTNETGATGGGLSHNNMPPYIAVWFIMRVS